MLSVIISEHLRFPVHHLNNDLGLDDRAVSEASGRPEATLAMAHPE
jgi:hypothetical protein